LAQDDYYYEIQLTNKQLVFYFLAGATLLISSFLLGVMVGRGVDAGGGDVLAAKPVHEEKIVPEEAPKGQASAAPDLSYTQRLESEKPQEDLEKPANPPEPAKPSKPAKNRAPALAASPSPKSSPKEDFVSPEPSSETTPKPATSPKATPSPKAGDASPSTAAAGPLMIQVGAFRDRAAADSIVGRLKAKGYSAFVVPTDGDLFNVRVGGYSSKADAEKAMKQLRDDEKFKPFLVRP
jgi:cell division protein FtsN